MEAMVTLHAIISPDAVSVVDAIITARGGLIQSTEPVASPLLHHCSLVRVTALVPLMDWFGVTPLRRTTAVATLAWRIKHGNAETTPTPMFAETKSSTTSSSSSSSSSTVHTTDGNLVDLLVRYGATNVTCSWYGWRHIDGDIRTEGHFAHELMTLVRRRKGMRLALPPLEDYCDKL